MSILSTWLRVTRRECSGAIEELQLGRNLKAIADLGLKLAAVTSHDASEEDTSFLENVATNRGSPVQFFDNEEAARVWLGIS